MSKICYTRLVGIIVSFLFFHFSCFAKTVDWASGEAINTTTMDAQNETYYIKVHGDVTMNGYIAIGNGATVYVEIADGVSSPVTLKNGGSAESFFRVYQNSKLIILGKSDTQRIILDGGWSGSTKKGVTYEMIGTQGTLKMQYVTVQNNYNSSNQDFMSIIKVNPGWTTGAQLGTTTIMNCTFNNCSAKGGTVLFTDESAPSIANPANTPTSCAITMKDVLIDGCVARSGDGSVPAIENDTDPGAGWGGILRFRGGWVGNFTMENVEIKKCTAEYCCSGVFWNAMGDKDNKNRQPKLVVDGCHFHHNTTKRSGGAMRIETLCEFTGAQTEISDNTAGIMGGGIHMYGYAGGNLGKYDFHYYLTDKLYIHDNEAQYGGGIGFQLTSNCNLTDGSTFNLHFNGATVSNNRAKVKGGGLYFENLSAVGKYGVNLHLNRGYLNNNEANPGTKGSYTYSESNVLSPSFYDKKNTSGTVTTAEGHKSCGGAMFVYNTNIVHEDASAGTLEMNNNHAMVLGGAVCVTGTNASANLKTLTASENTAYKGGGIACLTSSDATTENYSSVTLGNLTLNKCKAAKYGGGIYLIHSNLTIDNNASISYSTADTGTGGEALGGGLYGSEYPIINIGKATFDHNFANTNGGAIYLRKGGILNINNEASFTYNKVKSDGGGAICIKGDNDVAAEYISGTIQNAYFAYNEAYRGGAIEFDGVDAGNNVKFTLRNNKMEYNKAKLGGALLINEAQVTYEGGLIRWNEAKYVDGGPKTSFGYFPYNWNDNCFLSHKFSGFGGGIIISKDGSLSISRTHPFGIYANKADIAGNDISTVCSDRDKYIGDSPMRKEYVYYPGTVTIPKPENLNLSEFQVPVPRSAISWMEDYNQEDGAYFLGTKKQSTTAHYRYDELLANAERRKNLGKIIVDTEAQGLSKYLHLTLGYNFIFVKIVKQGLREGETAIFNISNKEGSTYNKYMTVAFTGKAGGGDVERIVALTVGDWRIEETNWSYTYTQTSENPRNVVLTSADANQMPVITFTNAKKDNLPPNDEAIKQNNF